MSRKRGNGEGSITKRKDDGRWMARYTVHTAAGRKRKTIYGKRPGPFKISVPFVPVAPVTRII